jgi:hypothetical protein
MGVVPSVSNPKSYGDPILLLVWDAIPNNYGLASRNLALRSLAFYSIWPK